MVGLATTLRVVPLDPPYVCLGTEGHVSYYWPDPEPEPSAVSVPTMTTE